MQAVRDDRGGVPEDLGYEEEGAGGGRDGEREEDGMENGRGRKRRTGKGKERERMEGTEGTEVAEDEWRGRVEKRLERLEGTMVEGFWRVLWMVEEVIRELAEVKELVGSESVGLEGSEEDGEGEEEKEEAVGQMVDRETRKESEVEVAGEGEAENGGDVEMVE